MIRKVKDYSGDFVLTRGMTLFGNKSSDCRFHTIFTEKTLSRSFKKTKLIFDNFDYPPFSYQRRRFKLSSDICAKYDIKNSII